MASVSRRALPAWVVWWLLRRRLRRSDHAIAAVGVIGLDLLGPRVIRHPAVVTALALTVLGLVVLAIAWLLLRRRGGNGGDWGHGEPESPPAPEPPVVHVDEPAVPVGA